MSSTITTKRNAGALRGDDGVIYYALFERTYESNVFPHDPSWGCIGFGSGADMVRRVFDIGSYVCGFLSCLCGSSCATALVRRGLHFLSCLCGSSFFAFRAHLMR